MSYVVQAPPPIAVPVLGTNAEFPVHRIYCVGRNYAEHAIEMGHSEREAPFFFCKPADAIVTAPYGVQATFPYPSASQNVHHEVELVIAIGRSGQNINAAKALEHVYGYAVGLDMTRRDLQNEAKTQGRPWDTAKAFDYSAPLGPIHPAAATGNFFTGTISLTVNKVLRQNSDISKLIWSVSEIIEHLSKLFELKPGDLIFSGTPAGVGAVHPGDLIEASIAGLGTISVQVS